MFENRLNSSIPSTRFKSILDSTGAGYFSSRFAADRAGAMCFQARESLPFPLASLFFRMAFADSHIHERYTRQRFEASQFKSGARLELLKPLERLEPFF